jgi:hypothetical protein
MTSLLLHISARHPSSSTESACPLSVAICILFNYLANHDGGARAVQGLNGGGRGRRPDTSFVNQSLPGSDACALPNRFKRLRAASAPAESRLRNRNSIEHDYEACQMLSPAKPLGN